LAERHQRADDKHSAGAMVEMRAGPDIGPRMARDQVDKLGVERILVGDGFVDPGIAERFSALRHPGVAALLVLHGRSPLSL
jgi:hypothetical protein